MKAFIAKNFLGAFAFDQRGELLDHVSFPKDPKEVADKLTSVELSEEGKKLVEKLRKKGHEPVIEPGNPGEKYLRENFREISKGLRIPDAKLNEFMTRVGVEFTKQRIRVTVKKDKVVIQTIDAIDEIDKSINIFVTRLREWYGLHFPEMVREVEEHEKFVKIVSKYGSREKIKEKDLASLVKESMGIELSKEDEKILIEYATKIRGLYKLRKHLEKYVSRLIREIAPNFGSLAGPLLAARMIALVGGLDKLAKKSSSAIQLLGAEKALFRHLRGRGRGPKYGILFNHPLIQKAPIKKRGKVARTLASKLSIAVKMDHYGNEDRSEELERDLKERIKKIMRD